jgi:RNA polymerase sigma factor (sigma-70 family)
MSRDNLASHLYEAHRSSLVNYADKLCRDRTSAEDVVQDAWLLFDRQRDLTAIRDPIGYLKRIVRNLVFARARRPREGQLGDDAQDIPDSRPSVEAEYIARQSMRMLLDAIDAMPDRQKAAIKMYHFDDLKLREVAVRLGLSVSYTHTLIAEGMETLARLRKQGI